ncbi:MAG TPA: HAMP domain-containing sensor histidine kinase [Chitinophagaceae bacterium]|nr:HAMP domain-containing sensor histidine kinase [Chitinophagaceae bacterium]
MTHPMKNSFLLPGSHAFSFTRKKTVILLMLVFLSCIVLIIVNYYTLRVTSSVRAYIKGESEFSKSQKDAFLYLASYIQTQDEHYRQLFEEEISVPRGDNIARVALITGQPLDAVRKGFLMGRNNPADFNKMIWLYENFHSVSFMKTALRVWEEALPLIDEADTIAANARNQIASGAFTQQGKQAFIARINAITGVLSQKERMFSTVLSNTARNIDTYLFWANVACILLILGSLVSYAVIMINRLSRASRALQQYNLELVNVNKELDTFVYSASHDLRSPIASLKGLVNLSLMEDDPGAGREYLKLMDGILERLDVFIKEIFDFFKNKRIDVLTEKISLQKLAEEAIALVEFIPGANNIDIITNIEADELHSDELRLKIILNNLISNAVKYSDTAKKTRFIKITSRYDGGNCIIAVEDNGVGIANEHFDNIFKMFFVAPKNKNGSGLGLHIVKETVEKLNGTIHVTSAVNKGSTFTVIIPLL